VLVEQLHGDADGAAVAAPFLGKVGQFVEVLGQSDTAASLADQRELVDGDGSFDVGAGHPSRGTLRRRR